MGETATSNNNSIREKAKVINGTDVYEYQGPNFTLVDEILDEVKETASQPTDSDQINSKIFIPDWSNKPKEVKPLLSYCGTPILTAQNTSGIIAQPGAGKSSICEAILTSKLNATVDSLGFSVTQDCEGVLFIDNERTQTDVWNSFYRMSMRAQIPFGGAVEDITIAGLRSIPRLQERKTAIEHLLQRRAYSLLIMDGAGDLVTDTNDLEAAIECRIWFRELTVKYNLSIFTTLHPNPNTLKPRGHIGSEILRECECVLAIKTAESDIRIITTDFEHGKNRNGAHISGGYRWSDEAKMFVSVDLEDSLQQKQKAGDVAKRNQAELLTLKILAAPLALSHTDLMNKIMDVEECKESSAKRSILAMKDFGLIKKSDDGLYGQIL